MKAFLKIIKNGGIAVIKTDTLYGLVASALDDTAVNSIYNIKKRDPLKPCIVLVSSILDIHDMGFYVPAHIQEICNKYWPGKVSIILDAPKDKAFHYLHRGTDGIAFRIPDDPQLCELLKKTGPLVAPSANPEGLPPARNIKEAMEYFGNQVSYYMDGGHCDDMQASKIIRIHNDGSIKILRDLFV